jgi:uncharacterized membrane protein
MMLDESAVHFVISQVVLIIEAFGVVVMIVGGIFSTLKYFNLFRSLQSNAYAKYRQGLAYAILLGLEILVAADIIRTITTKITIESLAALAMIVVIRTFLSFSLEVEIHGAWPWRRSSVDAQ